MVRGALFSACRCSRNDGRRLPTEGPAIPASGTISVVSALMLWLPELVGLIELSGLGALCSGRSQHFRRSPTGPWGNGSPTDSGSVSPGSNPGGPANRLAHRPPLSSTNHAEVRFPRTGGYGADEGISRGTERRPR